MTWKPANPGGMIGSAARAFAAGHDFLTYVGFLLAKLCVVIIVFSYSYETAARYFFNSPTWWSNDFVGYALVIGTFLALPELTRRGEHIAITVLVDELGPFSGRVVAVSTLAVSAIVCLTVGWISLGENVRQFVNDVVLVRVQPVPKVWLTVWITYGFFSSGLYFARAVLSAQSSTGTPMTSRDS